MYTYHAHHQLASLNYLDFSLRKLAMRVRNTYKSHQTVRVWIQINLELESSFRSNFIVKFFYYIFFNRYICRECFAAASPPMWMLILFFCILFSPHRFNSISFLFSIFSHFFPSSHPPPPPRSENIIIHATQSLCTYTLLRLLSICLPFYFMD